MDRDKLAEAIVKLQEWINSHDPTDEAYQGVLEKLNKLAKLLMEYDEVCDKQLERQNRLELETDKTMEELELKKKEIELKIELEKQRLEHEIAEAARNRRIAKRQAWWEIIKILLTTGCTVVLIFVTGHIEQHAILGQHQWSLIPKIIAKGF